MDLLGKSISSNEAEKSEFIESFAHLEQARIVELINLFIEEQKKFAALRDKHRHVGFFFDWLKTKTKKEWEEATRHYLEQKNNPSKIN
ncbi:MAG: hypothetical protein HY279_01495 [Nitrospinae bacterium]|nr:hypothetical protein [Nitrospinota bacterium]